ncbi:MAG: hypothetical protein DYG89_29155 [Caldilinea sp. CFX5]|nr:hypothetical protein [Caldilinea sp. CFX5]
MESRQSAAFSFLMMTEMEDFLTLRTGESETALIRRFRTWVRQQIANNWGNQTHQQGISA